MSSLFQEKQLELQTAVGKLNVLQAPLGGPVTGTAALELRKLYQELQIRNKLNQEQNSKLQQQKELLNKRNIEVSLMDKRISKLRQRLHKRKAEARQKEIVPLNKANGPPSPQPALGTLGRVVAVGPYRQLPVPGQQQGGYNMPPDPLKPQTRGINTQPPPRPQQVGGGTPAGSGTCQCRCLFPPGCVPGLGRGRPGASSRGEGMWHPDPFLSHERGSGGRRVPPPATSRRQGAPLAWPSSARWGTPALGAGKGGVPV